MVFACRDGRVAKIARISDLVVGQSSNQPEAINRFERQITVTSNALKAITGCRVRRSAVEESLQPLVKEPENV